MTLILPLTHLVYTYNNMDIAIITACTAALVQTIYSLAEVLVTSVTVGDLVNYYLNNVYNLDSVLGSAEVIAVLFRSLRDSGIISYQQLMNSCIRDFTGISVWSNAIDMSGPSYNFLRPMLRVYSNHKGIEAVGQLEAILDLAGS